MKDALPRDAHSETQQLLPWYVNDTLGESEHRAVAEHLENCAECRGELELLDVVAATVKREPATPIVGEPDAQRLLRNLDAHDHPGMRRWVAGVAIAASLGLLAISAMLWTSAPAPYQTATSGGSAIAMDYVLDLQFTADATDAQRDAVWRMLGPRNVDAADSAGSWQVTVRLKVDSLEELRQYTEEVEALPPVTSVEVVAVQLPIRSDQ